MRMPQPEVGHYDDEELNTSYVYTNNKSHEIKEDVLELMAINSNTSSFIS